MMIRLKSALIALSVFMATGFVFSGSANASCESGEQRTTTVGAIFTCDTSHDSLGEAWRDPSGLIWGDIVKNEDGSVRDMVQSSEHMKEIGLSLPEGEVGAKEYCESIGAHLPSKDEFIRLREYMGASPNNYRSYSPQVLPNLAEHYFWSSSVIADESPDLLAYKFGGFDGFLDNELRHTSRPVAVRCVVGR